MSVCSLLRYRLNIFLPPHPEVGCPIFFRDLESLGKSNVKKWSKIAKQKKNSVLADFALQNLVETKLTDGLVTSGQRAYC